MYCVSATPIAVEAHAVNISRQRSRGFGLGAWRLRLAGISFSLGLPAERQLERRRLAVRRKLCFDGSALQLSWSLQGGFHFTIRSFSSAFLTASPPELRCAWIWVAPFRFAQASCS